MTYHDFGQDVCDEEDEIEPFFVPSEPPCLVQMQPFDYGELEPYFSPEDFYSTPDEIYYDQSQGLQALSYKPPQTNPSSHGDIGAAIGGSLLLFGMFAAKCATSYCKKDANKQKLKAKSPKKAKLTSP